MRHSSRSTLGNFLEELCVRKSGNRPHQRDFSQRKKTTSWREGSARTNTCFSKWTQSSNYSSKREHEDGGKYVGGRGRASNALHPRRGTCRWLLLVPLESDKIWCLHIRRDNSPNTLRVCLMKIYASFILSFVQLFLGLTIPSHTLPKTYDDILRMPPLFRATLSL